MESLFPFRCVPCVGVGNGTRVLHGGQRLTVDGSACTVTDED